MATCLLRRTKDTVFLRAESLREKCPEMLLSLTASLKACIWCVETGKVWRDYVMRWSVVLSGAGEVGVAEIRLTG